MSTDRPSVTLVGDTLTLSGTIDPLNVVAIRREGEKRILASRLIYRWI